MRGREAAMLVGRRLLCRPRYRILAVEELYEMPIILFHGKELLDWGVTVAGGRSRDYTASNGRINQILIVSL